MGIHYDIIPVTTGDFTCTLHKYEDLPEYTKNTQSYIMTPTGHDRRPYKRYWSRPTTLYTIPVTTDDFIHDTGHDRRLYTRLTQLCERPQNTLKIHGRVF